VVGVITLSDIMITVMGDWVTPMEEDQQIIKRDNHSWLIDGSTPIEDVKHVLEIEDFLKMKIMKRLLVSSCIVYAKFHVQLMQ